MHDAALVADQFGLDPIVVLADRGTFNGLIRLAAYNIVQTAIEAARKAAEK